MSRQFFLIFIFLLGFHILHAQEEDANSNSMKALHAKLAAVEERLSELRADSLAIIIKRDMVQYLVLEINELKRMHAEQNARIDSLKFHVQRIESPDSIALANSYARILKMVEKEKAARDDQ